MIYDFVYLSGSVIHLLTNVSLQRMTSSFAEPPPLSLSLSLSLCVCVKVSFTLEWITIHTQPFFFRHLWNHEAVYLTCTYFPFDKSSRFLFTLKHLPLSRTTNTASLHNLLVFFLNNAAYEDFNFKALHFLLFLLRITTENFIESFISNNLVHKSFTGFN